LGPNGRYSAPSIDGAGDRTGVVEGCRYLQPVSID